MKNKGLAFVFRLLLLLPVFILSEISANAQITRANRQEEMYCTRGVYGDIADFIITIYYDPGKLNPTTENIYAELSDPTGDFTTPNRITSAVSSQEATRAIVTITLPSTLYGAYTAGEKFRVRIGSTEYTNAPVIAKKENPQNPNFSEYFPAYTTTYRNGGYSIHDGKNIIENVCLFDGYELKIDDNETSPLRVTPPLKFLWLQKPNDDIIGTGTSISIKHSGTYYSRVDYGSCIIQNEAKSIEVVATSKGTDVKLSSSLISPFCPISKTTLTITANPAVPGLVYEWYKDDVLISNVTGDTYQTNIEGTYKVSTIYGGCKVADTISLTVNKITSKIDKTTAIFNYGGFDTVEVTTDAKSPTYQWFLNDTKIEGQSSNKYDVSEEGSYKVLVTQNDGCKLTDELPFTGEEIQKPDLPNVITPNGDDINDVWLLPKKYLQGTNTNILIMDSRGKTVLNTNQYRNDWAPDGMSRTLVYYYIITPSDGKPIKGTLSVIKQ